MCPLIYKFPCIAIGEKNDRHKQIYSVFCCMNRLFLKQCLAYSIVSVASLLSFSVAERFEEIAWLIDPSTDERYIVLPQKYTTTAHPIYVKKTLYKAFRNLHQAAQASGIDLRVNSGRRDFTEQKTLFEQYSFDRALPPGTSSHHFWQAIDIANTYPWGNADTWLKEHAAIYWFCQTYDGHASDVWAESRHYEYQPEMFRELLIWFRDELYLYLKLQNVLDKQSLSKQELFDSYIYPISHTCIDAYPSRLQDAVTWIRLDRKLDSDAPDHLVYTLSRYKSPAWTGLFAFLPPEIRFVKTAHHWLQFASLTLYPKQIQELFFDYKTWFREWVERFVLLRTYQQLTMHTQPKISFSGKK